MFELFSRKLYMNDTTTNTGTMVTGTPISSSDMSSGSSQIINPDSNTSTTNFDVSTNTMSSTADPSMAMTGSESSQSWASQAGNIVRGTQPNERGVTMSDTGSITQSGTVTPVSSDLKTSTLQPSNIFMTPENSSEWGLLGGFISLLSLAFYIAVLVGQYVLSRKLDVKYPWLGLIPLTNIYNLVKISGRAGWETILLFIPLVNLFYWIFATLPGICKRTGHGFGMWVGLFFLFPVFLLIIAFGTKNLNESIPAQPIV